MQCLLRLFFLRFNYVAILTLILSGKQIRYETTVALCWSTPTTVSRALSANYQPVTVLLLYGLDEQTTKSSLCPVSGDLTVGYIIHMYNIDICALAAQYYA